MSEAAQDSGTEDSVRAETPIPMDADALFAFLRDIELVFRLNPHLEIDLWQPTPGGVRLVARDESCGRRIATAFRLEVKPASRGMVLAYADGLKRSTRLTVEECGAGASRLVVTESYPVVADPTDPRVAEVDRSLVPWVDALRRHLVARARWGWLPGWHWWRERFLPGMPPRQRRIVRLIAWIGLLEFVLFCLVVAVLRFGRGGP